MQSFAFLGSAVLVNLYITRYLNHVSKLLESIVKGKSEADEFFVNLITVDDEFKGEEQRHFFEQIQSSMFTVGIKFSWSFDNSGSRYARHIVTDTGWKISLDRGWTFINRTR